MLGEESKKLREKGVTLLESIMATVIVAIGFIAVFQMVQYSMHSIDTSGERTKSNYLVAMIAEDIIGDKNSYAGGLSNTHYFKNELVEKRDGQYVSWQMTKCTKGVSVSGTYKTAYLNKTKNKWDNRFSKRRLKCNSDKDTRVLKTFDVCSSLVAVDPKPSCDLKNSSKDFLANTGSGVMILSRMEVKLNNSRIKKILYFQVD